MVKSKDIDPAELWLAKRWAPDRIRYLSKDELSKAIKERISDYISTIYKEKKKSEPPFDPATLLEERAILQVKVEKLKPETDAILIPVNGGFEIISTKGLPNNYKRFLIAHEIGHTFFFDTGFQIPRIPFDTLKSRHWVKEGYASEIARMILMPDIPLRNSADALSKPSASRLLKMSKRYDVTIDLVTKRIIRDTGLWDCVVFRFRFEDGVIKTRNNDVVKGKSFKSWNIPQQISLVPYRVISRKDKPRIPEIILKSFLSCFNSSLAEKDSPKNLKFGIPVFEKETTDGATYVSVGLACLSKDRKTFLALINLE